MPSNSHRSRSSTISSFTTTPEQSNMSSPRPRGVGLSDPEHSAHRRRILGVIDRMRATGWVVSGTLPLPAILTFSFTQCRSRYGSAHDRRYRLTERGQVVIDRIDIRNHSPPCCRHMHQVFSLVFSSFIQALTLESGAPPNVDFRIPINLGRARSS